MKRLITLLITFCLVGFIFLPYFKDKKAPIPIDIPVGMYYPWLNYSYGYAVRPPVKNSLISDTVSQFWIWRNWGVSGLKEGTVNIWNPYSFSGYEMSPWFHTILFSPLNIFYSFLGQIDAMSWIVISQVIISIIGCYLLGSYVFSSSFTGWAFAIGWTFSSYFTGWLTWGTISFALAMIPWTIYFFEKYIHDKNIKISLSLCLVSLIFLLLSGHPQTIGYGIGIFYLWASIRMMAAKKNIAYSILFPLLIIVLSLVIASPVIIPSIKIIANSIRPFESLTSVNYGFIPWGKLLVTMLSVNSFGNPSTGNYFGGDYNFQEKLVNFGSIVLFLAIYKIVKTIKERRVDSIGLIGIVLLVIGIFISTQYPFGFLIYHFHLPLLSSSPAGRGIIVAIFGGVILSCMGLKDLLTNKIDIKSLVISSVLVLFSFITIFSIVISSLVFIKTSSAEILSYYETIRQNMMITLRNTIFPFGFSTIFLSIVIMIRRFKQFRKIGISVILLLMFLEGFMFFKKVTPFVPKNLYFPETSSLKFIKDESKKQTDLFRVERESGELLPPNMWEIYKFHSTSGYDPIAPLQYEKNMVERDVHGGISRYFENGGTIDKLDSFGVKYFISLKRDKISVPDKDGKIPDSIDTKKWKTIFTEGPVVVLENNNYKPPYYFVVEEKDNSIVLNGKKDNEWSFTVKTNVDNEFVLMENYSDNWHASIDNSSVKLDKYQGTYKKILIPKGEHQLYLKYDNPDMKLGIYVSVVGILLFSLFLLLG